MKVNISNQTDIRIDFGHIVGQGTFSFIYKGQIIDNPANKEIVMKAFKEEFDEAHLKYMFIHESSMMEKLDSPYIIEYCGKRELHFYPATDGFVKIHYSLFFEYMFPGDLYHVIRNNSLSWHGRIKVAFDISRGLYYLHKEANVIHRDLSSRNILINSEGAKISDFGSASYMDKILHYNVSRHLHTTVGWCAPEVSNSKYFYYYTQSSDIYSLGIIFYELIYDKTPHEEMRVVNDIIRASQNQIELPNIIDSECPKSFLSITRSCIDLDKNKRPLIDSIVHELSIIEEEAKKPKSKTFLPAFASKLCGENDIDDVRKYLNKNILIK